MATLFKSKGNADTDAGTDRSLPTIEARLKANGFKRALHTGEGPPNFPVVTEFYSYVVIAVSELDEKSKMFPANGFYHVPELDLSNGGFLFEPEK